MTEALLVSSLFKPMFRDRKDAGRKLGEALHSPSKREICWFWLYYAEEWR